MGLTYFAFLLFFFFFFQAEDGIRDGRATGVQTCALPIFPPTTTRWREVTASCGRVRATASAFAIGVTAPLAASIAIASRDGGAPPTTTTLPSGSAEIGRASCRERGEIAGGGGAGEDKTRK